MLVEVIICAESYALSRFENVGIWETRKVYASRETIAARDSEAVTKDLYTKGVVFVAVKAWDTSLEGLKTELEALRKERDDAYSKIPGGGWQEAYEECCAQIESLREDIKAIEDADYCVFGDPVTIKVTLSSQKALLTSKESEIHTNVVRVAYPQSGVLYIHGSDGSLHAYNAGTWTDYCKE